ncbi:SWIM zinc finger family protein [Streptomyces sp. NPDC000345]|uniref:SWIM zinc finger family protein n=1 Tax=Streptomyces sp. NPDC000345 TaxID=3364537 RepID=UPI0036A4A45F
MDEREQRGHTPDGTEEGAARRAGEIAVSGGEEVPVSGAGEGAAERPEEGAAERPADAVRRALRAARERGSGTEGVTTGESDEASAGRSVRAEPPGGDTAPGAALAHGTGAEPADASPADAGAEAVPASSGDAELRSGTSGPRPGEAAPRPADAARAALRRALDAAATAPAAAEPAPPTPATPAPGSPAPGNAASGTPTAHTTTPDTSTSAAPAPKPAAVGARPADLAREALRAARARARQDAADAPPTDAGPGRTSPRADARPGPSAAGDSILGRRGAGSTRGRGAGDRVARERARDVREFLADAFRMPAEDAPEPTEATTSPAPEGAARQKTDPGPAAPAAPAAPRTAADVRPAPTPTPTPALAPAPAPAPATEPRTTPGPPASPRSMAAPSRDGEHRRTFPAFPPLSATGEEDEPRFAETWWGHAWVAALEEGALDVKRLARGRGYAQRGHVDAITVTPGLVLAYVQGSRPRPYRVQVRLRTFGDDDWERFLDTAVERPAHIAALLDKEMPESLAECGVPLLPGPGELDPHCSCPDRAHPCKHAAALCYQTARLLDADPFVLLLLRGRGERELLDALSRRNATRAARAAQEQEPAPLPGVRAAEAVALSRRTQLPPLPAPLPVPPHPGQPPAYPSAPNGPDSFALDQLASDAAARAHALLATGHDEIGELTLWQDAVRLAAARPGSGLTAASRSLYAALATAAGRTPSELARAVAAWRQGGPDGLTVLEESWDPPAGRFDRARPLLLAADLPAFRPWRNHLTHPRGHVQLRFGRDGLWYAYESEPGHDDWWPRGTPDSDPVGALTGLQAVSRGARH